MREQAEWWRAKSITLTQMLSEPARSAAIEIREVLLPLEVFRRSGMVRTQLSVLQIFHGGRTMPRDAVETTRGWRGVCSDCGTHYHMNDARTNAVTAACQGNPRGHSTGSSACSVPI
jgi:hypothetical protein